MERDSLKRGVELTNRVGENGFGGRIGKAFLWWRGGKINKTTFLFLGFVFIVNLFLVLPLFTRDITFAYSSSTALMFLGNLLEGTGLLSKVYFFRILTFASLSFAPVSFYLFVRKTALGHEPTALLATLLYILPTPFWGGGLPFAQAILSGDGAHAFAFSFAPLLLLSVEAFIATGVPFWRVVSSIGVATTAVISPFAAFNLLIFIFITTTAEGFMGNFRVKFGRLLFLLLASSGLSLFWYYPNIIGKIIDLSHVIYAVNKFWAVFPFLIPVVPILGVIFFLVLDRREKLKPVFMGLSLFIVYLFLYLTSKNLAVSGIFTAERYLVEFSFARSFLLSLVVVLIIELILRNYILTIKNKILFFIVTVIFSSILTLYCIMTGQGALNLRTELATKQIVNYYNLGIGSIKRGSPEVTDLPATFISLVTFVFLVFILKRSRAQGALKNKGESS